MITFESFLNEMKLHRTHKMTDTVRGSAPLVWFSMDKKLANDYASYHKSSAISTIEYEPKNSVNVGQSERRLTISELIDEITDDAHKAIIDMTALKPVVKRLNKKFGNVAINLDQFWHDTEDFAAFLDICGFDSIMTTEEGHMTIGILRKYIK